MLRRAVLAFLALLFFYGAKLSLAFAVMPEVLVMLWIPNAIVLAALLRGRGGGYAWMAAIVAGELAADLPTFSWMEALSFGAINVLEVGIAFMLLRRWRFDAMFAAPSDIAKFVAAGPLLAAFLSAAADGGGESARIEHEPQRFLRGRHRHTTEGKATFTVDADGLVHQGVNERTSVGLPCTFAVDDLLAPPPPPPPRRRAVRHP